jgi:hypothetical protein
MEKGKHEKRMFTCTRHSETLLSRFECFHLSMKGGKIVRNTRKYATFNAQEGSDLLVSRKIFKHIKES